MAPSAISTLALGSIGQPANGIEDLNGRLDGIHLRSHATDTGRASHGHTTTQSGLSQSSPDELLDLVCVGFGPASLAIAIALQDAQKLSPSPSTSPAKKVLFLEKQPQFAWHSGMQLPGAKMQISFLKDLATPRDPTSHFTFLNYLFAKGRLNHFINLGTFLPTRVEYEDYLRWCASHFEREGKVAYGMDVQGVSVATKNAARKVTSFLITARDPAGQLITRRARHVVIAVGGRPVIPPHLQGLKHVYHSSQSANSIKRIQEAEKQEGGRIRKLRFAVVGSGQSAAEIFNDLGERFPDAEVRLVIKGASLRPSDDSPFVNEIFDPDRVDNLYSQPPTERAASIALDRGTNYGVVRIELLEHLYEKLYMQRLHNPDEAQWRCRIIPNRSVVSAKQTSSGSLLLHLAAAAAPEKKQRNGHQIDEGEEDLEVDYLFTATGYARNAHEEMLRDVRALLPDALVKEGGAFPVARDYRIQYDERRVDGNAGIWLQGCNEATHGLSDTLLSILAVRGGELVQSMFGEEVNSAASSP